MRIGVIGIGYWGQKVAREYISLLNEGKLDSLSLCDVDESKLTTFKGEINTFTNFDEFINSVDAIHVCTNNSRHYEITRKALNQCKHVLVEKPMTLDPDEAYELVEHASSNGCILQVGHIYRFANVIRKVKELYGDEYLGKPYYFNIRWTHKMQPIKGIDILWDLLPHPIDILNFITGNWPLEFTGVGRVFRREKTNEMVNIQGIYDNSLVTNIHLSWLSPIRRRTIEIVGSERTALVECVKQEINIYEEGKIEPLKLEANNTIRDEIVNFLNAIETGKSSFNSAIVGARAVDIIKKAIETLK